MILQLIFALLIFLKGQFCQSRHHQSYELVENSASQLVGQTYNFTLNWHSAQTNITQRTYALAGYQMTILNQYMSFNSSFYSTTLTYGQFGFTPQMSSFFKVKFYFILFSPCTDQIVVKQLIYTGSSNALLDLPVGFTFGADLARYVSMVFFKQITQPSPTNTNYLQIFLPGKAAGNSFEQVQVKTSIQVTICIGYVLLIKDSNYALYYIYSSYSATGHQKLAAQAILAPKGSYKCFLGLKLFDEKAGSNVSYSMKSLDSTHEVIYDYVKSNWNEGMYFLFCLAACSDGFYLIEFCPYLYICSYICQACREECLTCINPNQCVKCKFGTFTDGGCTDIPACAKVNSTHSYKTSRCIECIYPNILDSQGGCSNCASNYYYAPPYCVKIIGCIVSAKQNSTVKCIACDTYQNFEMRPVDSVCKCKHGFSMVDNLCKDICGDGQAFTLQCDDGNSVIGDGCSDQCVIEKGFSCIRDQNKKSNCKYYRKDITLQLQTIEKVRFENKAVMTFVFRPTLHMDKLVNISEGLTLLTNRSITIEDKELIGNELTLWINFNEDLEGYNASLIVQFQKATMNQLEAEVQFKLQSNGQLIITKSIYLLRFQSKFLYYFSIGIIIVYVLSFFSHKTIGLQFLFPFQIIYLSYILNSHPTSFISVLNSLGVCCFNFMVYFNDYSNLLTNGTTEQFSEGNMQTTVQVVLTLFAGLSVLRIIKLIICNNHQKGSGQKGSKLKFIFFVIDNSLFSLSISFLMVSFLLLTGESMRYNLTFYKILMFPIQFIISIKYFQEWVKKDTDVTSQNLLSHIYSPKVSYTPILLSFYLSSTLILAMANQSYFSEVQIGLSVILSLFLTIVILYPPYKTFLNNFGVVFSILLTIFFLIWFQIRNQNPEYRNEQNELIILIVLIAMMFVSALISVIRIIKVIYKLYLIEQRIDQLTLKMKQQISQQLSGSQMAGLKKFRAQISKDHQNQKESSIFRFSKEIPFNKFNLISPHSNDLKNYLLKLTKDHQSRIGSNIIIQ